MGLAVEDRLLLKCCRVKMGEEAIRTASDLLEQNLDWDYILEASIRHGVSPLLHHGLEQIAERTPIEGLVPAGICEELRELHLGNRARNRRLYRVIEEIAAAFEQAGIALMGLKDIQLARELYPDMGLRPMGDLDLLIQHQDYDRAAACLAALGFVPLPSSDIPFIRKYAWAHNFQRPADDVWVDLQWNVLQIEWDAYGEGSFDFEIDRMWRGARQMSIGDAEILVPGLEDMLFHLCLHLEGHRYAELILFCDIVEFVKHYGHRLDWAYLLHITKLYRVEPSIYYVLLLAQKLFDIDLPASLWQELEPGYHKASVFEALFGNLAPLHLSLDETRQAALPPACIMADLEATVRLQATAAMQLYTEIDQIASDFADQGGRLLILDGAPSERIFADPLLTPFEEIRLFVLGPDLPCLQQILSDRGFEAGGDAASETYHKCREIISRDPALAGRPAALRLQATVATALDGQLEAGNDGGRSKKEIALRLLKARLAGRRGHDGEIPAPLAIVALSPEDLLVYLAARLGTKEQDRLFGLSRLLEFFRRYSGTLDWQRVEHTSRQYGLCGAVGQGLSIVQGLVCDGRLPPAIPGLAGSNAEPRILKLARYGPASLGLYTDLKPAFLYLLSLLAVEGWQAKARYLLRSLAGQRGRRLLLPRLLLKTVAGLVSRMRPTQRQTITDMAYWVESRAPSQMGHRDDQST